jgi:large subunit ribosomal protein L21
MKVAQKPSFDQYAIFQIGSKQYQAIPGKTVAVEKCDGEAGSKVSFSEVLFRKTGENKFEFGKPFVTGAAVNATIVKQDKAPKVIVFKFQRRKKVRTKNGHRQSMTIIRIENI